MFSMLISLLFDTDWFYFEQMTTGFRVCPLTSATFLMVGLTGVDLAWRCFSDRVKV